MIRLTIIILLSIPSMLLAQKQTTLNLADLYRERKITLADRVISIEKENDKQFLKFVGNGLGGGMIWLPVEEFRSGKIELMARGMDVLQGSFVGVAFHAVNDSTYDYVYCRPFNFETTDSLRRMHMIQYTFHPKYQWQFLRTNYNGKYEKGIANAPKIHDWFKMTLEIDDKQVKAYINDAKVPSLVVDKLNQNSFGKIGISGTGADVETIKIEYK